MFYNEFLLSLIFLNDRACEARAAFWHPGMNAPRLTQGTRPASSSLMIFEVISL
jgi:hypothetical protein